MNDNMSLIYIWNLIERAKKKKKRSENENQKK